MRVSVPLRHVGCLLLSADLRRLCLWNARGKFRHGVREDRELVRELSLLGVHRLLVGRGRREHREDVVDAERLLRLLLAVCYSGGVLRALGARWILGSGGCKVVACFCG